MRTEFDRRIAAVTSRAPHRREHIAFFVDAVLDGPAEGCLVECGAYEGVSAAKWSHLADMLDKKLYVFDSFRGLPAHDEQHGRSILGHDLAGKFHEGAYAAHLDTVRSTVERYGVPEVVTYVEGWFADTLPGFNEPVAGVYLDVDLATSTTTCLEHLWPLVTPGGVVVSQDGDFPHVIDAIRVWLADIEPSEVVGLGDSKMVKIRK
jgi:O-methyltransferase